MAKKPRLIWRGDEVREEVTKNMVAAMGEFSLRVEGNSKRELRRGHGVLSGTLRRSIHCAEPGYNWQADNVVPAKGTPERGGKVVISYRDGSKVTVQVGSGLLYALAVHQGHHSFEGYHYLTNGLEKTKPELPIVLRKHQLRS